MSRFLKQFLLAIGLIILFFFLIKGQASGKTDSFDLNPDVLVPKTILKNYRAFFGAESHGVSTNPQMRFAFVKYLHEEEHVNFLILEISFSSGYFLNEYLKTGDETLLNQVFSYYKGTTFYTVEDKGFYRELYHYNHTEETPVTVIGIDLEHSDESAQTFLNEASDMRLVDLVQKNQKYKNQFYAHLDFAYRENKMYENYLTLAYIYRIDKFYAQFGSDHCLKRIDSGFTPLAYDLNFNPQSNVYGTVYSIMTEYEGCFELKPVYLFNHVFYLKEPVKNDWDETSPEGYDLVLQIKNKDASRPLTGNTNKIDSHAQNE